MSASIGNCNVSREHCRLFQSPSLTAITNIEYKIEGILGLYHVQAILSEVSAVEARSPSVIKTTGISKLWITLETIAECALNRNTQLMRNKSENVLSRHFTINYRIL